MKSSGFTLIEFVIVTVLAAIFMVIAVPSYYSMIQNNKIVSVVNKLSASFNYARTEAVKRGVRVSVCPAASAALNACGDAGQWGQGWVVFVDEDNDNNVDGVTNLIKVHEGLPRGLSVNTTSDIVSYDSAGFLSNGAASMVLSASGCTGNHARSVNISTSGRLSIAEAACP